MVASGQQCFLLGVLYFITSCPSVFFVFVFLNLNDLGFLFQNVSKSCLAISKIKKNLKKNVK